ncbi:MAG: PadR family transcriptional regulator [Chloroflexi bacterium]|nr:PadR family transcriptional regulator [Chloroflexota bacterium]
MGSSPGSDADLLPLREPTFLILLSLASSEKHGYSILKDIAELSQGKVRLSTGTLYEALARLLDQGLIERLADVEPASEETQESIVHRGKPRKAYRLTDAGRKLLQAETQRMQRLVATVGQRMGDLGVE